MDASKADAIRPFSIHFPDEALVDLRRRINATNWRQRETVTDASQGVQLATMRELARYWETKHDWRKIEARLNALPQFVTDIDGLNIPSQPISAGPGGACDLPRFRCGRVLRQRTRERLPRGHGTA